MENTYTPLKSYLESSGQQFSQDNLKSLATSKGIANYTGTDVQNKQLAGLLTPTTPLATTPPPTTNVNANSLIQTNPISLPNTPVTTVPTVPISAADRILNQINLNEQTNAQKAQENIIGKKLEALAGLTGESAALVAEQEKAGVNRLKTELQNINTQILTKQAEIQQDDISLISKMRAEERRDTLLPFAQIGQAKIQGDAAIYRALKQSEIGVLNATAIAKQGDIQLAKETAQEAVDIKYAPYKEQIKQYDAVLEAIAPLLSRDEKIQATKQQIRGQVAMKEIDREAANEKQLNDMLIQASSQNAPASLLSKAKLAKTPSEAAMILGQYAGDYYAIEKTKTEISKLKAEAYKLSNPTGNGNGIPAKSSAQAWLDQYNAGSMSLEDIYTKIGNSKTAEVTKNQLAKLIAAQGGKRVLSMDDAQVSSINEQIKNIDDLVNGSVGSIVGFVQGGLGISPDSLNTGKQDALAIASNLVANQTLQSLADAKAKGVTFGALSEAELNAVASAASRVASKAIVDKETGKIKGFTGSEKEFIKDLNNIKTGLQKSVVKKTTSAASPVQSQVDMAVKALNAVNTNNNTGGYIFK